MKIGQLKVLDLCPKFAKISCHGFFLFYSKLILYTVMLK